MYKRITLLLVLLTPIVAWSAYKPVRILAPEWNGVSCITDDICVESPDKADEAKMLYASALQFINQSVDRIEHNPRVTFCSTAECFQAFGFRAPAKAKTVGVSGIVVGPDGWQGHIVRHEMIHHLQSEQLGILQQWRSPPWFKEGMAYALSVDPRNKLSEPFESYRQQFQNWHQQVGKAHLWQVARTL